MSNPFENTDESYLVLINEQGQYSLWPAFALVPAGWTPVFGQETREACLAFVDSQWTDMRPQPKDAALAASELG
ncbi:MbtH family protein [Paenibacillus alba]|uniref:MbtH family protein n=1 Tax=Paenibacillus alba TaxID=1197127 RepID=A0ABU6G5H0_9BACL|nr:MbtH family protein [Paenibacillus alba]MEC0228899.1 MbtH family protein [Paenibacillus alba]